MSLEKIKIISLKISKNIKGDILKYINKKDKYFKTFGEIYFTEIKKNNTKGWNFHKRNQCLITVRKRIEKKINQENINDFYIC